MSPAAPRLGTPEVGRPWPLGITVLGEGANVAVLAPAATAVELCLFAPDGGPETARLRLPERSAGVHHGYFPGLLPGMEYGLRAHGPWQPREGQRCNAAKLLLDPYARALAGAFRWGPPHRVDPAEPLALDPRDSAPFMPRCVVTAPAPTGAAMRPDTPWEDTVLYELHVKGMTRLHPDVPPAERGTWQGLAHPAVLEHLVRLGVTAVELMPVAAFLDERRLVERGLVNYWGYNPFALFVPEARYTPPGQDPAASFRAMVAALHGAGIEVILDVVFNHTAESDELGPTISFRGLDNALYYRLRSDDRALYVNDTGCGNTLDTSNPHVLRLVMDALRHWAGMGVDGFRFDLGTVLGRDRTGGFDPDAALLQALRQDPQLGGLKLIAEPWDIGFGGYQLGRFPPPFAEWNDRFRDAVRRFWRGDEAVAPELAARLLGSAELFEPGGRPSSAGVNLVAAHDGCTTADLVSYAAKHNQANGEDNRDGHHENYATNHGVEGPSTDPAILARRRRHVRNLLATLLLAQGTPMLAMGDEVGRSQGGNNNAYCQDNRVSWFPWDEPDADAPALLAFVRRVVALRSAHPVLRRRRFLHGRVRDPQDVPDVLWFAPDGRPMTETAWQAPATRALALLLNGRAADGRPGAGAPDAPLLLLLNAGNAAVPFTLPALGGVPRWRRLLDTGEVLPAEAGPAGQVLLAAASLALLAGEG